MSAAHAFASGGGDLGALIRSRDWEQTPLGPLGRWPQSLRSALSICLHSTFPTAIYWGPDLRLLYNDAWAPIPAERHPWALGRPGAEVWSDIWDVVGPQFEHVMATGEGFSTYDQLLPMVRDGVRQETYWNYSFTAIRGEDGAVVGVFNQGNETTAAVRARRQAEAEIARLGRMFSQAPGAVAILSGPSHVFEIVNAAYETLVGRRDLVGKPVADALPEIVAQGFVVLLDRVYATGEPHAGHAVPVSLRRTPGEPPDERFVDFIYQPLIDAQGVCTGIFVQATDVTEQQKAEQARQLLLRELDHRVKNLFAMMSGMVALTARSASSVSAMSEALKGRLQALAKAHDLIRPAISSAYDTGRTATLRNLIKEVIQPHVDGGLRLHLSGPDVSLGAASAAGLALILHELATNATKYGAFASSGGSLDVAWAVPDGNLELDWREHVGGRQIQPPTLEGFGSRLARASVSGQLGGEIAYDWQPDGVRIHMTAPLGLLGR